jgi:nitrite reductase/ring-hydroxylating ferredoxin subunit
VGCSQQYVEYRHRGQLVLADHMSLQLWHVASFIARFQKAGDYLTLEVSSTFDAKTKHQRQPWHAVQQNTDRTQMFGWNFILIRDKQGNINAFHNICRHRGHPVTQKSSGCSTVLACRFHGWSYLANGELHTARAYNQLPDFDPKQHGLFKIHTHVTPQGFIFVNFDARPTPAVSFGEQFGEDFEPMPKSAPGKVVGDEFALFPREGWEYDHTWNSSVAGTEFNWKTFVDGFQVCRCCAMLSMPRVLTRVIGMLSLSDGPPDHPTQRLCLGSILPSPRHRGLPTFSAAKEGRVVGSVHQ